MFTAWKNGPEDNSLEGRKKRLIEGDLGEPIKPEGQRPNVPAPPDPSQQQMDAPRLNLGVRQQTADKVARLGVPERLKALQSRAQGQSAEDNLDDIRSTMGDNARDLYDQLMAHNEMGEDAIEIMENQNPELTRNRALLNQLVTNASRRQGHEDDDFDAKKTFARLIALGSTYQGRNRRGQGARSLGFEQVQQLLANKDNLIREFGNGTPDEIREMVNNRLIVDTPMEDVIEFYKSMPPAFQRIFAQGNAIQGPAPFLNADGEVEQMNFAGQHYLGDNDDGTQKRGTAGQKARKLLQLKRLMDQGFIDPYTGLPLSPDRIELDHVRAVQSPDEGEEAPRADSFPFREHPDNWLHADAGVNSMKDNRSMADFLENVVEPLRDKKREDYNDLGAIQESGKTHAASVTEMIKTMLLDEDGYLREGLDPSMIDTLMDQEGGLIKALADAGVKQSPRFAKEFFSNFRGGGRGKKIVRQQTGVKNQFTTPPWAYIPLIRSMVGQSREDQDRIANGWNQSSLDTQKSLLSYLEDPTGEDPGVQRGKDGQINVGGSYSQMFLRALKKLGIDVSDGLSDSELKKLKGFLGEGMFLDQELVNEL